MLSPLRAILYGALTVGLLDGLDAIIFFGLRGATPARIFQAIAAGVLGRQAAIQGGVPTAVLGVAPGAPAARRRERRADSLLRRRAAGGVFHPADGAGRSRGR